MFEIGSKSLRKLLLFKFNGVGVTVVLNGVVICLFVEICVGKLGDGVIDGLMVVVDKVDDKSLDYFFLIELFLFQFTISSHEIDKKITYFNCGVGFDEAMAGILIEAGNSTSLTFFAVAVASLSLFKQDDLKSSKLNSGNDFVVASTTLLKK